MNNNCSKKFWSGRAAHSITRSMLAAFAVLAASGIVSAQDKKDEITFNLLPNPAVVDCLRANPFEEPRARATVIRGKQNDTLILDLDGIKPGLAFDLFTVQNSFFQANGTKDPNFTGSFGLAWYQSDIKIGKQTDDGHVQIKTILLDDIFGFDPDVRLDPTNTFHLGFWFDNPLDAAALPSCHFDPTKPTPFNGEHRPDRLPCSVFLTPRPDWARSARTRTIRQRQPAATQTEADKTVESRGDERIAPFSCTSQFVDAPGTREGI